MLEVLYPIIRFLISKFISNLFGVIKSRWMVSFFIVTSLSFGSLFTANNFYVYQMKKKYINLFEMKKIITSYIKGNLNKAIELGIVDFSLLEGITIEDIKISQEEDFSNNKLFFTSQRVDIRLSSIFSEKVYINNIIFYNTNLELDINEINSDNFLTYLKERNLPKIEFRNLNITIKDGNKEIIKTNKPIQLIITSSNNDVQLSFDDSFFKIPMTLSFYGTGLIDSDNRLTLDLRFNHFPTKNITGLMNYTLGGENESGEALGFIRISRISKEINIEGDIDIINYYGSIGIIPGLNLNSMSLNAKFSYFKETDELNKSEEYFKRKISNPNFFFSDSIMTNKLNLRKIQINTIVEDFSKLSQELVIDKNDKYSGKLNLVLEMEETGKVNDWILSEGRLIIDNFYLSLGEKKLDIEVENGILEIDNKNNLRVKVAGRIFESDFQLSLNSILILSKTTNNRIPFQYNINGNLELNIEYIYINDYIPIFESIKTKIQDDIKERQEKMLPESYIIESFIYKTLLEKLVFSTNIRINNISKSKATANIGSIEVNSKFSKANLDIEISDRVNNTRGKKQILFKIIFDRKNPYYDLKIKLDDINWDDNIYNLCGWNFSSGLFDVNLSFSALGNNFSDLLVSKNFAIEFYLKKVKIKQTEDFDTIDLSEIFGKDKNFDIKGVLSGYGQENSFKNLEINAPDYSYRGYSISNSTRGLGYQFSIYGNYNGKNINYNFIEVGNKCQLRK